MAEGTYEYEVMRAELLGVEKPDYEEFLRKQKEKEDASKPVEEEAIETEKLKVAESQNEDLKSTTGKLDELNNILSLTQKKLNNFKFRCSSVTSYMKTRLERLPFTSSASLDKVEGAGDDDGGAPTPKTTPTDERDAPAETPPAPPVGQRKSDLARALDNHVDKLDGLLEKAEAAEVSMSEQRKQMRSYLN